jgi:hypothetical protein
MKKNRSPRKHRRLGELPESLVFVDLPLRIRRGDAVDLANIITRMEREWFAIRDLKEALEKAGIKPTGGWL